MLNMLTLEFEIDAQLLWPQRDTSTHALIPGHWLAYASFRLSIAYVFIYFNFYFNFNFIFD
jgi:hypothetical protein